MKIRGIRFCQVSERGQAHAFADIFTKLGFTQKELGAPEGDFNGAVFPIEHHSEQSPPTQSGPTQSGSAQSWIELWPAGENMPEMVMLQIIVDDADAVADLARQNGLDPKGPDEAHGERIYYLHTPTGLPMSFQSKINDNET